MLLLRRHFSSTPRKCHLSPLRLTASCTKSIHLLTGVSFQIRSGDIFTALLSVSKASYPLSLFIYSIGLRETLRSCNSKAQSHPRVATARFACPFFSHLL